jgi:hypothetical protein
MFGRYFGWRNGFGQNCHDGSSHGHKPRLTQKEKYQRWWQFNYCAFNSPKPVGFLNKKPHERH